MSLKNILLKLAMKPILGGIANWLLKRLTLVNARIAIANSNIYLPLNPSDLIKPLRNGHAQCYSLNRNLNHIVQIDANHFEVTDENPVLEITALNQTDQAIIVYGIGIILKAAYQHLVPTGLGGGDEEQFFKIIPNSFEISLDCGQLRDILENAAYKETFDKQGYTRFWHYKLNQEKTQLIQKLPAPYHLTREGSFRCKLALANFIGSVPYSSEIDIILDTSNGIMRIGKLAFFTEAMNIP